MTDMDVIDPRLSMGANHPPAEDAFALRVEKLVAATNAWATHVPKITDLDTSKKCRDFIAQVTEEWDALEAERKTQKKPHDDAAAAVQARFSPLLRRLQVAKDLLKGKLGTWLDFEDARLKRENVKFLEEIHPWGNSRAAMIEGPDRIAIELVEVK